MIRTTHTRAQAYTPCTRGGWILQRWRIRQATAFLPSSPVTWTPAATAAHTWPAKARVHDLGGRGRRERRQLYTKESEETARRGVKPVPWWRRKNRSDPTRSCFESLFVSSYIIACRACVRGWSASETALARVSAWAFQSAACKPYARRTTTTRHTLVLQQSQPAPHVSSPCVPPCSLDPRAIRHSSAPALAVAARSSTLSTRSFLSRLARCFCFVISLRCLPAVLRPSAYTYLFPWFSPISGVLWQLQPCLRRGVAGRVDSFFAQGRVSVGALSALLAPYSCPQLRLSGSLAAVAARLLRALLATREARRFSHVLVWRLADHKYRSAAERAHVHGGLARVSSWWMETKQPSPSEGRFMFLRS